MDGFTLKTPATVGFLAASRLSHAWASESREDYRRALGATEWRKAGSVGLGNK